MAEALQPLYPPEQTGECVLVTKTRIERLHNAPRGFARI
jgi:hypothetical protein